MVTINLLSYGVSQLFIGSFLDSIGRYRQKLCTLLLLVLSSLIISLADSILIICVWRIIQGTAVSTLVVANRALFMDIYEGSLLKNYLIYFTMIWFCEPILAPFLGGYLEKSFHWGVNFYFLALYAAILFLLEIFFGKKRCRIAKKQIFEVV